MARGEQFMLSTDQNTETATDVPHTENTLFGSHGNQAGLWRDGYEFNTVCRVRGHFHGWMSSFSN